MAKLTELGCQRRHSVRPLPCVCGCGNDCEPGRFFEQGHDQRLRGFITRNAPALKCVLWCSVPLCFNYDVRNGHNGDYADQIRQHRRNAGCTDTSEIVSKRNVPCPYDENPI